MISSQVIVENKMNIETCQICQEKLSIFTKGGKHNFCPGSFQNGQIVNICIKCKMKEILKAWKWQML